MTEAQEETLESESEITLQDILNEVSSIRELESEQLDELRSINSNLVISGNNSNTFGKKYSGLGLDYLGRSNSWVLFSVKSYE